jgi:probable S-adenosylmethionine-dependent methyltransferase, YraL family
VSIEKGALYVVATPIGNLGDMSARALEVLAMVDVIAAEDTRHSLRLLRYYGIQTPLVSFHQHSEVKREENLLQRLEAGEAVALISDAGTPLISDPGHAFVRRARERGIRVTPVPGPSAVICALSVAGLSADRFVFEGFLPRRPAARRERLKTLKEETRTVVIFEASHRIVACLDDLVRVLGQSREAVLTRELTKAFETIRGDTLERLAEWVRTDTNQHRGEFVIVLKGAEKPTQVYAENELERMLRVLIEELPICQAASLAARIAGCAKQRAYHLALSYQKQEHESYP